MTAEVRRKPFGVPLTCPKPDCGYGILKLPDRRAASHCPNDGKLLIRKPKS